MGKGLWERGCNLTFAVEKEDNILAKGFVVGAVGRDDLNDFICQGRGGRLIWSRIVCGYHVLFIEYELHQRVNCVLIDRILKQYAPILV